MTDIHCPRLCKTADAPNHNMIQEVRLVSSSWTVWCHEFKLSHFVTSIKSYQYHWLLLPATLYCTKRTTLHQGFHSSIRCFVSEGILDSAVEECGTFDLMLLWENKKTWKSPCYINPWIEKMTWWHVQTMLLDNALWLAVCRLGFLCLCFPCLAFVDQ